MKRKYSIYFKRLAIPTLLIAFIAALGVFGISAPNTAYAQADTFQILFPQNSYFQTSTPNLIAVNGDYLAVYDDEAKVLFIKSKSAPNYHYDLEYEKVDDIYLLEDHLFISADGNYYTLDLTDYEAAPAPASLTTPDNISYLASDGTYLYAKNYAGNLSAYDKDMQPALDINNIYDADALAGKAPFAAENGIVYLFATTSKGEARLLKYDAVNKRTLLDVQSMYMQSAFVGSEVIFAQITGDEAVENYNHIVAIDKQTGSVLFTHTLVPDNYAAFGDKLYSIEGEHIAEYTLSPDKSGLTQTDIISMKGDDLDHFDGPCDITSFKGALIVADGNNDRLAILREGQMTELDLGAAPLRVTADASGIYVLTADGILKTDLSDIQTVDFEGSATDIAALDKFYVLADDGVYTFIGGKQVKVASVTGARRIACADGGNNIYLLKDDGITVLTQNGEILPTSLTADLSDVKDFAVDYSGNITALYSDKIVKYANHATSLSETTQTPLVSSTVRASANSLYVDGKSAYFTADECLVGEMSWQTETANSFEGVTPSVSVANGYRFVKLKEDVSSVALPSDGRYEGMFTAPKDTLLAFATDALGSSELCYALNGSQLIIILKKDFEEVATTPLNGEYVVKSTTAAFEAPYVSNETTLNEATHVTGVSDVGGYDDNKWSLIIYNDKTYFVETKALEEYHKVVPEDKKLKGRAKADRVGGLVNIYGEASKDSAVLTQIVDGTQVEILGKSENFYAIKYGDVYGFMLFDDVKIGGLTTVQIISLVLAVFVLVAGTTIFIAIYNTKKNLENEEYEKSKQKSNR